MAYGTVKVDNIIFTNGGADQTITVSGIVQSISGDITATGTVQGATIIGTSTVSGATVTGEIGSFTSGVFVNISGATISGNTATFTSGVFALGTSGTPSISFSGDINTGIYSPGADQLALATNGTQRLLIEADGDINIDSGGVFYDATNNRLAIGTSAPNELVHVVNNGSTGGTIQIGNQSANGGTSRINMWGEFNYLAFRHYNVGGNGDLSYILGGPESLGVNNFGFLAFGTRTTGAVLAERMRLNNAGELLIGYTTDNGAYRLQVNSQIFATSATIATSDGRYKENVNTLDGCLDLVKALRPVSFTWKPQEDITRTDEEGNEVLVREGHNFPEGTQVGFIAQEVQEVLEGKPWLNSIIKENVRPAVLDNDGNELAPEEQFFGIAEGNLISVLTNALQEAVAEIESLKARVTALET